MVTAWNMQIADYPCCLQKCKCAISGEEFMKPDDVVCYMKVPKELGGYEQYKNLLLLHRRYLPLLVSKDEQLLKKNCKSLAVTKSN